VCSRPRERAGAPAVFARESPFQDLYRMYVEDILRFCLLPGP